MKKLTSWPVIVANIIVLAFALIFFLVGLSSDGSIESRYYPAEEVRYVGEKIIQNSEGYIYEYEYEFVTKDEEKIYSHSLERKKYNDIENIKRKKPQVDKQQTDKSLTEIVTVEEYEKEINSSKVKKKYSAIGLIISTIFLIVILILKYEYIPISEYIKEKEMEKRKKLWDNDIPMLKSHLVNNYDGLCGVRQIIELLNKIEKIIYELDNFYEGRKDEEIYRKGFRAEIESAIELCLKNVDTDMKFSEKLMKVEFFEDLYQNLEKFLSYIESQMYSVVDPNSEKINQKFEKINAEAELSGEAIEYLAQKYKN